MTINLICFIIVCLGWAFSVNHLENKFNIAFWSWLCGTAATTMAGMII